MPQNTIASTEGGDTIKVVLQITPYSASLYQQRRGHCPTNGFIQINNHVRLRFTSFPKLQMVQI